MHDFLVLWLIVTSVTGLVSCSAKIKIEKDSWRVFALEYGASKGFRKSVLVRGAPPGERAEMSWAVWLLLRGDKKILVDTGFAEQKTAEKWKFERFQPVPVLLNTIEVRADEITDVILTHLHWDHCGNMKPYRRARFWVQRAELDWARGRLGKQKKAAAGVRRSDLDLLDRIAADGRVSAMEGDTTIADGVKAHLGGRHTGATQWIEIETGSGAGTALRFSLALLEALGLVETAEKLRSSMLAL